MTGIHGQADAINVEPVRLFYIPIKLTMPQESQGCFIVGEEISVVADSPTVASRLPLR